MGQVACLKEIPHKAGKPTYVCYLDFQNASNTVPGMALEFIKALYNKSQVQVTVVDDIT